jgi:amidase
MIEPWKLPAWAIARQIGLGQLTAVAALEAQLDRIDSLNPTLNAVVSLDRDLATRQAEAADKARAAGSSLGPLHGVPMTLKDAHDVRGLRTTVGLSEFDRVANQDGAVASRLRAAGAIVVGHSNVPAGLGDYLQSANPIFGRTGNPWDPTRNPGGSSGGAAAAVAAGMTPIEVGSDLVASTRLPAHYCGVYGLKTTEHRVPLTGFFRQPEGVPRTVRIISVLGPIARDLEDLELVLRVISGPDGQDGDVPPVPFSRRRRTLPRLRIAIAPTIDGVAVSDRVRELIRGISDGLVGAGAHVVERIPDVEWDAMHELYGELLGTITSGPDTPAEDQRSAAWYLEALDRRDRFTTIWHTYFQSVDALIVPAGISGAFSDDVGNGQAESWRLHGFANLTGLPALAAPAGLDENGMPLGIQIVGTWWSEMLLLEIARELERARILPGFQAPPRLHGVGESAG